MASKIQCDVYDPQRLPHYGAIDYALTNEAPLLTPAQIAEYEAMCARWSDASTDGLVDRDDYQIGMTVTMKVIDRIAGRGIRLGAVSHGVQMTFTPGDLRYAGMSLAAEDALRSGE